MAMFRPGTGSPFPVGTNPVANATADVNGDGHHQLLVANYDGNTVSVLLGDGNGGFPPAAPVPLSGPADIQAGDLNGHGHLDCIAGNRSAGPVSVVLNNGTGGF